MGQQPAAVRREIPRVGQGERPVGVGGRCHSVPHSGGRQGEVAVDGTDRHGHTGHRHPSLVRRQPPPRRLGEGAVAGYERRDRKAFEYA